MSTVEERRGKVFNLMAALEASLAEAKDKAHAGHNGNGKAKHKTPAQHKRKKSA
jgi:hypothetical protein